MSAPSLASGFYAPWRAPQTQEPRPDAERPTLCQVPAGARVVSELGKRVSGPELRYAGLGPLSSEILQSCFFSGFHVNVEEKKDSSGEFPKGRGEKLPRLYLFFF